ncbi:MAG: hypothetical protein JW744_02875 [Candidatus Diapherotrites archaeon]|uniref:Small ribosomal subunit protein eS1 n=1 Tax=Candidatus Iainarchaeum sp. TaxID=3101447 RepID=A0A938YWG7_9ARCH|nr:hypothetical protein [Candidatus Diapherotrites archaeon]
MALDKEKPKRAKKTRTVDKWKKKQWFQIIAPKDFDEKALGETIAEKEKNLIGRTIEVNLGDLTGQRQKRHIKITFKVNQIEGTRAKTAIVGHKISHGFLNRLVRRRASKIELTQFLALEGGKRLKVKTMVLSLKKLGRKQERALANELKDRIEKAYRKKAPEQAQQEFIFGAAASKLFKQLKKIAPLKRVEVIESKLIEGK